MLVGLLEAFEAQPALNNLLAELPFEVIQPTTWQWI